MSLALDSNHVPGIAFNVANDTYMGVAFWRPGMAAATLVAHNDGYTTNDNPAISLTFFGTQARIATDAEWTYGSYDPDSEPAFVWVMRALDSTGLTWSTPVNVTSDNANVLDAAPGSQPDPSVRRRSRWPPIRIRRVLEWCTASPRLPFRRFPELSDNCSGAGGQSFILAQQCAPGVKVRSQRQALAGLQ